MENTTNEPIRLSRKELYLEVWSTPTRLLAEKLGISDVGLAKACKRMRIPRPPRGYWRRKETGFPVRRTPLPKEKEGDQLEIVFFATPETQTPRRHKSAKISPEVFLSFCDPHPLVERAAKALKTTQTEPSGILRLPRTSPLAVHVSKSNLEKSLRLVDAFLKAWLKSGHEIRYENGEDSFASLASGSIELALIVYEEPDGRLSVEISGKRISRRRTYRRRLREKQRLSLEAWTGRILAVALSYLERRKETITGEERRQRELEEWKQNCARRALEQEEAARRRTEERRKTEALLQGANEWRRIKDFLEFIAICRERLEQKGENPESVAEWMRWAEEKSGSSLAVLDDLVERITSGRNSLVLMQTRPADPVPFVKTVES